MTTAQDALVTKDYVDANGVHTYYEVHGEGDPVVLLHVGVGTIETWGAQTAALAERYKVYLPERRGHGRTADVDGPITYYNMADDTIAFMDALGISNAHLIGWSDGGNVGLIVALKRPDLVRKLVLMGCYANHDGIPPDMKDQFYSLTADAMPPMMRAAYDALSPDGPEHFPIVFEKLIATWKTEPTHQLSELEGVTAPTLVMLGDDDVLTIEHAGAMAAAIPDAQIAIVPGTDHAVVFEKPDLVNRLFLDFLADEQAPKLFGAMHEPESE
jgi:pimeloyl-ACP methyl ester carboxylesterase